MAKINPIQQVLEAESYKIIEKNHPEILEVVDNLKEHGFSNYQIVKMLSSVAKSKIAAKNFSMAKTIVEDGVKFYLREVFVLSPRIKE